MDDKIRTRNLEIPNQIIFNVKDQFLGSDSTFFEDFNLRYQELFQLSGIIKYIQRSQNDY
jgi:hypothetical protein